MYFNVECISSIHFLLFGQSDEKQKNQLSFLFLFFTGNFFSLLTNKKFISQLIFSFFVTLTK